MTRWNNLPVSTLQETTTNLLLASAATAAIILSVKLQHKRREKENHCGKDNCIPILSDPIYNVENPSKGELWSKSRTFVAICCNVSTLLASLFYILERQFLSRNPYVQNGRVIAIVALAFGSQLFRFLKLICEKSPDLRSELVSASRMNIFQRLERRTGVDSVHLVLLLPCISISFLWTLDFHWITADILCLANTVMLTVDLSKFKSLQSTLFLMVCVLGMIYASGHVYYISKLTQTMSRCQTLPPLGFSLPTSPSLSTFLSINSFDVLIIGILASFLHKLDHHISSTIRKNGQTKETGDGTYRSNSNVYFVTCLVGFNVGMFIGFLFGFGMRTSQSLLYFSIPSSILGTISMAIYRREWTEMASYRTKSERFKIC